MCYYCVIIANPPFTKPPFVNSRGKSGGKGCGCGGCKGGKGGDGGKGGKGKGSPYLIIIICINRYLFVLILEGVPRKRVGA